MQPGTLNLTGDFAIYQGDTYDAIPMITLPDLSSRGRPSNLTSATVRAQVRDEAGDLLGEFTVTILNAAARQIKPTMSPAISSALPLTSATTKAHWDLQVTNGGYVDTHLRGKVQVKREETRG